MSFISIYWVYIWIVEFQAAPNYTNIKRHHFAAGEVRKERCT